VTWYWEWHRDVKTDETFAVPEQLDRSPSNRVRDCKSAVRCDVIVMLPKGPRKLSLVRANESTNVSSDVRSRGHQTGTAGLRAG
jgi:hypothetical protein